MNLNNMKTISIDTIGMKSISINGVEIWREPASYTNLVPTSTDTDGSIFNGVGYKDDVRLSSSGSVSGSAQAGSATTGFMPYSKGGIVRLKGGIWAGISASVGHYYIHAYNASKGFLAGMAASDSFAGNVATYDATTGVTTFDFSGLTTSNSIRQAFEKATYFRLNAKGAGADLIVTVNEEIG